MKFVTQDDLVLTASADKVCCSMLLALTCIITQILPVLN